MIQIAPHETAVTLFHVDGDVWTYRSKSAALRELGYRWICANVGRQFCTFSHAKLVIDPVTGRSVDWEPVYVGSQFIMRDDHGGVLTGADFDAPRVRRVRYWSRCAQLRETWNGEGPVPGVRRRRGGHYFRHPKTQQERRWAEPLPEYDEPAPRPKRNAAALPSSWDDYAVADRQDRSWKRYRRHQYKGEA